MQYQINRHPNYRNNDVINVNGNVVAESVAEATSQCILCNSVVQESLFAFTCCGNNSTYQCLACWSKWVRSCPVCRNVPIYRAYRAQLLENAGPLLVALGNPQDRGPLPLALGHPQDSDRLAFVRQISNQRAVDRVFHQQRMVLRGAPLIMPFTLIKMIVFN